MTATEIFILQFLFVDTVIKQNLNSLLFVKTVCEEKIKRLQQGIDDNEYAPDVSFVQCSPFIVLLLQDVSKKRGPFLKLVQFLYSSRNLSKILYGCSKMIFLCSRGRVYI